MQASASSSQILRLFHSKLLPGSRVLITTRQSHSRNKSNTDHVTRLFEQIRPYVNVIHEDRHLLVVNKPSGILSQPNDRNSNAIFSNNQLLATKSTLDMLMIYKAYLLQQRLRDKSFSEIPSIDSVYLGLVQRLDRETSGIMVLAKTSKAASRISALLRAKSTSHTNNNNDQSVITTVEEEGDKVAMQMMKKTYLCVVEGSVKKTVDVLKHQLRVTSSPSSSSSRPTNHSNNNDVIHEKTQAAMLKYELLQHFTIQLLPSETAAAEPTSGITAHQKKASSEYHKHKPKTYSLLEVELTTGRKHQIRAQLASIGHPIVNDTLYGASRRWAEGGGIALHAFRLQFPHPIQPLDTTTSNVSTQIKLVDLTAPLPFQWKVWFDSVAVLSHEPPKSAPNKSTSVGTDSMWTIIEHIVQSKIKQI